MSNGERASSSEAVDLESLFERARNRTANASAIVGKAAGEVGALAWRMGGETGKEAHEIAQALRGIGEYLGESIPILDDCEHIAIQGRNELLRELGRADDAPLVADGLGLETMGGERVGGSLATERPLAKLAGDLFDYATRIEQLEGKSANDYGRLADDLRRKAYSLGRMEG